MPFVKLPKCNALIRILLLGHLTKSIGGYEFLLFDFHAGEGGGEFSCFLAFWQLAKKQEGFLKHAFWQVAQIQLVFSVFAFWQLAKKQKSSKITPPPPERKVQSILLMIMMNKINMN